jgi:hypothetical protein
MHIAEYVRSGLLTDRCHLVHRWHFMRLSHNLDRKGNADAADRDRQILPAWGTGSGIITVNGVDYFDAGVEAC